MNDFVVDPCYAAVFGDGGAATRGYGSCGPVDAGVVVDVAVGEFDECGFASSIFGEWFGGVPGFAVVITVDCVGVVVWPLFACVFAVVVAGRAYESAGVWAASEGDAGFVHMHGGGFAVDILVDGGLLGFPCFAVVGADEEVDWGGWVSFLDEGEDVAIFFIDGHSAGLEARFFDNDFRAVGFAAIGGASEADVALSP